MRTLLVGGSLGHKSGVIDKLAAKLSPPQPEGFLSVYNGVPLPTSISGYDLILWFPDIDNAEEKNYPLKDTGAVLISSKVMREGLTKIDAISRVYMMHGNAAVCIRKEGSVFGFELVDALGNTWTNTSNLHTLAAKIKQFYDWTKGAIRKSLRQENLEFLEINKALAQKISTECGNRFFGNYSTRCRDLFPSKKINSECFLFSPRNLNKEIATIDDFVVTTANSYIGSRKPSVDAPVQLAIYKDVPWVNFMIHGHAFIKDGSSTTEYFPCGDLREAPAVIELLQRKYRKINLKQHGFLIAAESIKELKAVIDSCTFEM